MKHKSILSLLILGLILMAQSLALQANPSEKSLKQLTVNCVQCHAVPSTGAPIMGDTAKWKSIFQKGKDTVFRNVVYGINGMPPRGYCSSCSEKDLRELIHLISGIQE